MARARRRPVKLLYQLSSYHPAGGKRLYVFSEMRLRIRIEKESYKELLDIAEEMLGHKPGDIYKSKHIHAGCDASERSTSIAAERKSGW